MSAFRKSKTPGVSVRHQIGCPAADQDGPRCRCKPAYRSQKWGVGFSPSFPTIAAAQSWKASAVKGERTRAERASRGITFGALALQWWEGVEAGSIGKRKGRKDVPYTATTLAGYRRTVAYTLAPRAWFLAGNGSVMRAVIAASSHEHEPAASLGPEHWQAWVDDLAAGGLSRSRIANHLAVVSAIYGWASRATRKIVPSNPTVSVEMPPNDEVRRERVATADHAAALLAALGEADRVPYAIAFYAGLRRGEIARLTWADVDFENMRLTVRVAKSEAGTGRQPPIAAPLVEILRAWDGDGAVSWRLRAEDGQLVPVSPVSVMSGKLAARASSAWLAAGLKPIGLHECRHTYASLLVAAGYNLKEIMSYLGHADLTTTSRYVKLLPQPGEASAADRLNAYLGAPDIRREPVCAERSRADHGDA